MLVGVIVAGRCLGSIGVYKTAWELSRSPVPEALLDRVKSIAYSKRFIILWRDPLIIAYLGEHGDHILVDHHYCSCEGFTRRTTRMGVEGCSHIYASRIALGENWYRDLSQNMTPQVLARIVWEALTGSISYTLRRMLASPEHMGYSNDDSED